MRTTLDLDEDLVAEALRMSGLPTKTAVIEEGLRVLLQRKAAEALIAMRGSAPHAKAPPRCRIAVKATRQRKRSE
ncbi:MAG: type II toxin-antitoxin system VapB family antitoxin [Myxococcales bacterium]|nr:type II toxin-antitoxin system VapB family antitoxin [Myxococcales bacterium]